MKIIFATNNSHKVDEARKAIGEIYDIVTPSSLGYDGDIPETHPTILENSMQKAQFIWDRFHTICFSDDTGLEIDALGGAPGVFSARYAGDDKNPAANRLKVLKELEGVPFERRTAHFVCIVTLIEDGVVTTFEGTCEGYIALAEAPGVHGFGYDSIFIPEGKDVTMAEITIEEKNAISHRGKVLRKLQCHLYQNHRQ